MIFKQQIQNHPNTFVYQVYNNKNEITEYIKIDKNGLYVAKNLKNGKKYSNDTKAHPNTEHLHSMVIAKCQIYKKRAIDIAYDKLNLQKNIQQSSFDRE